MKKTKSLAVEEYDLVISDFEPVSAWACKRKHKHCVGAKVIRPPLFIKRPPSRKKMTYRKSLDTVELCSCNCCVWISF